MDKTLKTEDLIELLKMLPSGSHVYVNNVGNLSVMRNEEFYGYIDFLEGSVDTLEDA